MCFNSSYFLGEMHLSATQEDPFPPASYLITAALSTDEWTEAARALARCRRQRVLDVSEQKLADRVPVATLLIKKSIKTQIRLLVLHLSGHQSYANQTWLKRPFIFIFLFLTWSSMP